jgi:iron complex transport system permease protein
MQVVTRNPLASPGILGLNGGAALAVVAAGALGAAAGPAAPWIALAGAAAAGTLVQAVAGMGRAGPIRLTLVGAALSIFLTSLTQGVLVVDEATLDESRRWLAGSVGGRSAADLGHIAPFLVAGLLGACALGGALSAMALGDEVASSLGVRPGRVRLAGSAVVVALAGASVAVAGPVGFVGLAVPHVSRFLVGEDQRWVLAGAAVLGAGGLVAADLAARVVAAPNELPLGAVTAMVGAPFFVWLARTVRRRA